MNNAEPKSRMNLCMKRDFFVKRARPLAAGATHLLLLGFLTNRLRVATLALGQQYAAMPNDRLTEAVRQAVRGAPCSVRALARAAGVPDSTLVRIVGGERAATPAVAAAVARALNLWGTKCGQLAQGIRQAQLRRKNG